MESSYIRIPKYEEVIRCNNRIYDRNNKSDIDITENQREVFRLYSKKNESYFVNQVFPAFKISDQLDLSRTTIYRALRKLEENELIVKNGSNKTGKWKIVT